MKPSTVVEILGFGAATAAGFVHSVFVGLIVAAISLLLIGYGTEDRQAALSVARIVAPHAARYATWQIRRRNRRTRRVERRSERRRTPRHQPAEMVLHVKAD